MAVLRNLAASDSNMVHGGVLSWPDTLLPIDNGRGLHSCDALGTSLFVKLRLGKDEGAIPLLHGRVGAWEVLINVIYGRKRRVPRGCSDRSSALLLSGPSFYDVNEFVMICRLRWNAHGLAASRVFCRLCE